MATAAVSSPVDVLADRFKDLKVDYKPDYEYRHEWFLANEKRYESLGIKENRVPEGYPSEATGSTVWDGKELVTQPSKWLHTFTPAQVVSVRSAVSQFLSRGLPLASISPSDFPLSDDLERVLSRAVDEIHGDEGLGFRVFRGLPIGEWNKTEQIVAFLGISSYIGDKRLNQGSNRSIVHLRDITKIPPADRPKIIVKGQTGQDQVFHTDAGDVVGMISLGQAEEGGSSQLSSTGKLYNTLVKNRPDVLRTLVSPIWKGRRLIHLVDDVKDASGKVRNFVSIQYARRPYFPFYEDQKQPEGVDPLPYEQNVALDAINYHAAQHSFDVKLQPGDLEYFDNQRVLHARTASVDSEKNTRHLLRIWLRNTSRALPHDAELNEQWNNLTKPFDEELPDDFLHDRSRSNSNKEKEGEVLYRPAGYSEGIVAK